MRSYVPVYVFLILASSPALSAPIQYTQMETIPVDQLQPLPPNSYERIGIAVPPSRPTQDGLLPLGIGPEVPHGTFHTEPTFVLERSSEDGAPSRVSWVDLLNELSKRDMTTMTPDTSKDSPPPPFDDPTRHGEPMQKEPPSHPDSESPDPNPHGPPNPGPSHPGPPGSPKPKLAMRDVDNMTPDPPKDSPPPFGDPTHHGESMHTEPPPHPDPETTGPPDSFSPPGSPNPMPPPPAGPPKHQLLPRVAAAAQRRAADDFDPDMFASLFARMMERSL